MTFFRNYKIFKNTFKIYKFLNIQVTTALVEKTVRLLKSAIAVVAHIEEQVRSKDSLYHKYERVYGYSNVLLKLVSRDERFKQMGFEKYGERFE